MHAKPWCKRLLLQTSTMLTHSNAAFHTTLQRLQRVQNCKIVSRTTKIPPTLEPKLSVLLICCFQAFFGLYPSLIDWMLSTVRSVSDPALIKKTPNGSIMSPTYWQFYPFNATIDECHVS